MKVCISLRDPAPKNLKEGNLRSEPRWERLALEASINNPEVTEIYTSGYEWTKGQEVTKKYCGKIQANSPKDIILITQDWNTSIVNLHPWKAIVMNIFIGPWKEQIEEINAATKKINNNIFFVVGHSYLFREGLSSELVKPGQTYEELERDFNHQQLGPFTTMDRVVYLPLPWIPTNCYSDRFYNKNLLFSSRLIFLSQLENSQIFWALNQIDKDHSLKLDILSGWEPHEVKDHVDGKTFFIKEDINEYFWKNQKFEKFSHIKENVKQWSTAAIEKAEEVSKMAVEKTGDFIIWYVYIR